jgi:p-hydroxybenzoate 3-monooxygenase
VVLDSRGREEIETTVRAGVLEHGTAELLRETGVGKRMDSEGMVHRGIELRFAGRGHRVDLTELTGRSIVVYGQNEVVKDLNAARLEAGGRILWEAEAVGLRGLDTRAPVIRFRRSGGEEEEELSCDFVAGCDGFHGICRPSIPAGARAELSRTYPFGWFGILAESPPSTEELVYALHERGFSLVSMRSPTLQRLYFQCDPRDSVDSWPDERVWEELRTRLATHDGWTLQEGEITQKTIVGMRSFVCEPMRHGRLFLAGDAAHIVPPTGAKGMNLAVADVRVLVAALAGFLRSGSTQGLDSYSATCLRRVWRAQRFSWWMTSMLHRLEPDDPFGLALQIAELDYVTGSRAASTALAENYVGLPMC